MTNLQLSAIISQALFVGTVYQNHKNDKDFDENVFKNYARGMLAILMRDLNIYDEKIIEKAIEDFSAMGKI
tara:strand:- start:762 stop:974 length:213 start_codon:yes stop_codon:yes gene_type:complete